MDRTGANFYRCVEMFQKRLAAKTLVIQLPIGEGEEYGGLIDLVKSMCVCFIAAQSLTDYFLGSGELKVLFK